VRVLLPSCGPGPVERQPQVRSLTMTLAALVVVAWSSAINDRVQCTMIRNKLRTGGRPFAGSRRINDGVEDIVWWRQSNPCWMRRICNSPPCDQLFNTFFFWLRQSQDHVIVRPPVIRTQGAGSAVDSWRRVGRLVQPTAGSEVYDRGTLAALEVK